MQSKCEIISCTSIFNLNASVQAIKFRHVISQNTAVFCNNYNTTAKNVIYNLGTRTWQRMDKLVLSSFYPYTHYIIQK